MLAIREVPEWIRGYERRRRIAGVTVAQLSRLLGKPSSWWSSVMRRAMPPRDWPRLESKVKRILSAHEDEGDD